MSGPGSGIQTFLNACFPWPRQATQDRNFSAPNAHPVSSPIPVACTNPCRANISRSSGLVFTGVNHAHPRCAYANAGSNPYPRSADTRGCYRARDTSFGYAHGLAINGGARRYGGETQAQS